MQPIVLVDRYESVNTHEAYVFKGATGNCYWPKQQGQGLGQCGMLNFLWRVGFHPDQYPANQLPTPDNESILFVDKIHSMDDPTALALQKWMQQGGKIVATGELISWQSFLPSARCWQTHSFENPYAGMIYLLNDYAPQLIAPSQWSFITHDGSLDNSYFQGQIAAAQGERQTPARAHIMCHPNAPAIIQHDLFYYLNGQPFSALQAWLQGQENLSPWTAWRHRLFWLDEWISFFCDLLFKLNVLKKTIPRPGIQDLGKTTVIIKHDLDYSRDITFLSEEKNRNITATHAVLKDRNTRFWVDQLKQFNNHEIAFHYNTGKRSWKNLAQRLLKKKNRVSFTPHFRQIARHGLLRQLKWAKQHGVDIQTIHRHLYYLIYPEWVDAMDTVFESGLEVLGSNSLFRAHVLRWGINEVEGNHGYTGEWPDAQFPVWYPFRLTHAAKGGKILKGWEMTALMEVEPYMLTQILDHQVKHISQNIFTLIFHPAHANQPTFYRDGSFNYFKSVLSILTERKIDIMPMRDVLQKANQSIGNLKND